MNPRIWGERTPEATAITLGGVRLSYRELGSRGLEFAHYLRDEVGLVEGDHIAICAGNRPEYLIVCWAAQMAGLYWTTVNTHLTAEEAAYIVKDCGARVFICSIEVADLATALAELTPAVRRRLVIGGELAGHQRFDEAIAHQPSDPVHAPEGQPMLYTSGSTGSPKGIKRPISSEPVAPERAGGWLREVLEQHLGVGAGSVFLVPAPLYHTAPVMWSMAANRLGAHVVLMERFDAEGLLAAIARVRATHVYLVPTMMTRLTKLPREIRERYDTSSLRGILHAAAPCPPALKEEMIEWFGPIVTEVYGMTEGFGWTVITSNEALDHRGSVGVPRGCQVHVRDEHGNELAAGEEGVIWFSAPDGAPMPNPIEYHGNPQATARLYDERGWATVGDLGYMQDGYLYLTGRESNIIISGGVNISAFEVERALTEHPKVLDVAVVGVPDEYWGEAVLALVLLVDPDDATEQLAAELIEFCGEQIARFKRPKRVRFVEELPREDSGKLRRHALQDILATSTRNGA